MNRTPLVIAGVAAAAIAVMLLSAQPRGAGAQAGGHGKHPEPRAGITGEKVLTGAAIPRTFGAVEAYAAAKSAAATLDGVYCYCDCSQHAGHRSLLTCFESDHGSHCDICMEEATLAAQLAGRGTSLDSIRAAIDRQFGT
jgi:hypothetical protein